MTELTSADIIRTPLLAPLKTYPITVLLIDDQQIVVDTVRRMLASENDIVFHACTDPIQALDTANRVHPTVILQDLVMPNIDGLDLTRYFRANPDTRNIPLIVLSSKEDPKTKVEAFAIGANDYLVKLPDQLELIARIRYHSNAYIRLLERNEAYEKLLESQRLLNEELADAAEYVRSLLPPVQRDRVSTSWQFVPSTQLGGDAFGYYWLDKDHFIFYLLDVCGHGIGAALLSISVINTLRAQTLPNADFHDPISILQALNLAFVMEQQNNMFFTIWYGVYNAPNRLLCYASAGHPPALFLPPSHDPSSRQLLRTDGLVIGAETTTTFSSSTCILPPNSQLFLFSDGTYEITKHDGNMLNLDDWLDLLVQVSPSATPVADAYDRICSIRHPSGLADDYSLLHLIFH